MDCTVERSAGATTGMAPDTDPHEATDAELVARLAMSDAGALDAIMRRETPALVRIAMAITGSPETARDVVQDVFVRLWLQRETFTLTGSLGGYLWHVTRDTALKAQRRTRLEERALRGMVHAARVAPRMAYNEGARALDAESMLSDVTTTLNELPARCRQIFLLKLKYRLSAEEIASSLGISLATTRNQLSRAVSHLAARLGRK